MATSEIRIVPVSGIPEVKAREDLPRMIARAAGSDPGIAPGDVLVVTQKIVSKAEGRVIDLSTVGAQVVSPTVLRPNQKLRVALTNDDLVMRFRGAVAWARFELGKGTPQYRAGVEFSDADPASLGQRPSHSARHHTFDVEGDHAPPLGEPGRVRVLGAVDLDPRQAG